MQFGTRDKEKEMKEMVKLDLEQNASQWFELND